MTNNQAYDIKEVVFSDPDGDPAEMGMCMSMHFALPCYIVSGSFTSQNEQKSCFHSYQPKCQTNPPRNRTQTNSSAEKEQRQQIQSEKTVLPLQQCWLIQVHQPMPPQELPYPLRLHTLRTYSPTIGETFSNINTPVSGSYRSTTQTEC